MKLNHQIKTYGDTTYRGDCPKEDAELITAVNWLRMAHKELAEVMFHVENEGKRTKAQADMAKAKGLLAGVTDLILITTPAMVLEVKRADHTQSSWQKGQQEFMLAAQRQGAFVGLCLGADGVKQAVQTYFKEQNK